MGIWSVSEQDRDLIQGGREGLHENYAEIDFLVVSDRGDRYLSDAFGPMKKYCS